MIQQTSLEAYQQVRTVLSKREKEVYEGIMRLRRATNMELANYLGWSINRVTPRVKELRDKGLVGGYERRMCKITGNSALVWGAL